MHLMYAWHFIFPLHLINLTFLHIVGYLSGFLYLFYMQLVNNSWTTCLISSRYILISVDFSYKRKLLVNTSATYNQEGS
jgi:hypothetical protein